MSLVPIPKALFHLNLPGGETILPTWRRASRKTPGPDAVVLTLEPDFELSSSGAIEKLRGPLPP